MRQFIPATRSLIVLIAFLATGVSANLRNVSGVFFGSSSLRPPKRCANPGSGAVLRRSVLRSSARHSSAVSRSPPPSNRRPAHRTGLHNLSPNVISTPISTPIRASQTHDLANQLVLANKKEAPQRLSLLPLPFT
jgi:hypothetical protein